MLVAGLAGISSPKKKGKPFVLRSSASDDEQIKTAPPIWPSLSSPMPKGDPALRTGTKVSIDMKKIKKNENGQIPTHQPPEKMISSCPGPQQRRQQQQPGQRSPALLDFPLEAFFLRHWQELLLKKLQSAGTRSPSILEIYSKKMKVGNSQPLQKKEKKKKKKVEEKSVKVLSPKKKKKKKNLIALFQSFFF